MWELATDVWPFVVSAMHVSAALAVTVHAVLGRRDVPAIIGWVGLAWLAPVVGSLLYLAFGINRIQRAALELQYPPIITRLATGSRAAAAEADDVADAALAQLAARPALRGLMRLGQSVTGGNLLSGNTVTPLIDGDEAYPAMLDAIAGASRSIGLMSYIFDADRVGNTFLDALSAAQARGVQVRVLIDDVGSRYSHPAMPSRLRAAGVRSATFLPTRTPRLFRYANLRNHRKVLVVDGRVGFTGGMNIRDGHQLSLHPESPVRCLHFRIDGPVVADMQRVFSIDWAFSTGESLSGDAWACDTMPSGDVVARGIPDGPDADVENLPEMLLGALAVARERVRIVTPYFLPDARIRSALRVAAMRGVAVDIVVPARNNIPVMDWAMVPQLTELLEVGCHVWQSPPPFDHTKLFVVDGIWSLIGSTNWDARSLRLNFEYNVECFDRTLAARLESLAESRILAARRMDLETIRARSFPVQLRDGVARLLSPYL
jgi:cardiolipin synthase A/B